MSNYKGVWSLPSIKYDPAALPGVPNLDAARTLMERLSRDRLGGVPISVLAHLTSGSSGDNPMGVAVTLHLYEVDMHAEPEMNPRFYTEAAWMTPEECKDAMRDQIGGLCTRLWSEYAIRAEARPRDVGVGGMA